MTGEVQRVPLADFVAALRDEIAVMAAGADPEVPIEMGPVSVEFTLLTRNEGGGEGGGEVLGRAGRC